MRELGLAARRKKRRKGHDTVFALGPPSRGRERRHCRPAVRSCAIVRRRRSSSLHRRNQRIGAMSDSGSSMGATGRRKTRSEAVTVPATFKALAVPKDVRS